MKTVVRPHLQVFWLIVVFFACPCLLQGAPKPDPTSQMKPFVEKITKMLADANLKEDVDCSVCQRLIDVSRERFDFDEMSKRVLGKTWRRLDDQQKEEFVDLFTQLLQYAYIGKIEDYKDTPIRFVGQRIRGRRAEVKTEIASSTKPIAISYIMLLEGDQWMVYDVVAEGVSLVRNYMEQFRDIVRKEGYEGLVKQLRAKIDELEKERRQRLTAKSST